MIPVPATLPAGEIVRCLNDTQPPALLAHTSALMLLADEQRAGRLRISPQSITATSQLLTDQDRNAVRDAFGVPPIDQFVSTEGLVGHSEPGGAVLSFATDMCIAELVDARNRPVADGVPSAKVLLTNLHNHTQPLIRYELTDRFIRHLAAGDPYLRAAVEGRADEAFRYGTVTIDPLVTRTVMVRTPNAAEYQVARQTPVSMSRSSPTAHWTMPNSRPHSSTACAPRDFPTRARMYTRSQKSAATPRPARPAASSHCESTPDAMPDKARTKAFWTDLFNTHDLRKARDFFAPGFINYNARPGTPDGPEAPARCSPAYGPDPPTCISTWRQPWPKATQWSASA